MRDERVAGALPGVRFGEKQSSQQDCHGQHKEIFARNLTPAATPLTGSIDAARRAGRNDATTRDDREQAGTRAKVAGIERADAVEQRVEHSREQNAPAKPIAEPAPPSVSPSRENPAEYGAPLGAKRESDADLVRALGDQQRDRRVGPDRRERERECRKQSRAGAPQSAARPAPSP